LGVRPAIRYPDCVRLHGDKLPGDGYYGAILPALAPGMTLEYFFRAIDLEGQIVTSPVNHDDTAGLYRITVPAPRPALRLSEVVAGNHTGLCDEAGQPADWLEILNTGATLQNLEEVVLFKDYYDQTNAWHFPTNYCLGPGEYCIVFCDDNHQGPFHANFKLSSDGDRVFLIRTDTNWTIIDSLSFGALPADTSFGVVSNGTVGQLLFWPTPGAPNQALPPVPEEGQAATMSWRLSGQETQPRMLAFRWMGCTNGTWEVRGSPDLTTWTLAPGLLACVGQGFYEWSVPVVPDSARFYRAIWKP
jgi:hypothetical protein